MLNFRQITAFRAMMLAGTVTQAANALHISQPAVSRLISSLEHNLRLRLFERSNGRLLPTAEARLLFVEVDKMFDRLADIEQFASSLASADVGRLRISCMPSLSVGLLPRVVADFLKQFPKISISLEVSARETVLDTVATQQVDLGLVTTPLQDSEILVNELGAMRAVCIMPESHPLATRSELRPGDLANENFIAAFRDTSLRIQIEKAFHDEGLTFSPRIEARTTEAVSNMVSAGLGIAIISQLGVRSGYYAGTVVVPFLPLIENRIGLIYPSGRPKSLVCQKFVAALATAEEFG